MNRKSSLQIVLAIIGIGAFVAYFVACRPSWSPDGSKVLFPYFNPKTPEMGIALFDRNTRKTRALFVMPSTDGTEPGDHFPWAQWDRAGEMAIVAWTAGENDLDELHVTLVPVESQKPTRTFVLPDVDITPGLPIAEADGSLFVGGKSLIRLDLATGKVERRQAEEGREVVLVSHKDQVYYCSKVSSPSEEYEIGTVDKKKLLLDPGLTLQEEEVGEIFPLMVVADDGSALAVTSTKDQKHRLLLVAGAELKKSIPLDFSAETHKLGNLQWSPDGETIYLALAAEVEDGSPIQLAIGEVTVDTGAIRVTPVLRIRKTGEPEVLPLMYQIALSPDGKTMATAPTYLGNQLESEADLALHLVDLTSSDRKVSKIPVPIPQSANQ